MGDAESVRQRVAATLSVIAGYCAASFVAPPGLRESAASRLETFWLTGLGIRPAITAYVIVELLALAIPRFRRLRSAGDAARARLDRVTSFVTLAGAAVQAVLTGAVVLASEGRLIAAGFEYVYALGLFAGAVLALAAARLVTRLGIVNGFVALFVADGVLRVALTTPPERFASVLVVPLPFVVGIVLPAVATWAVLAAPGQLRQRAALRELPVFGLPVPGSSVAPLLVAPAAVWLLSELLPAALGNALSYPAIRMLALLVVTVACALLLTRVFHSPARLARFFELLRVAAPIAERRAGSLCRASVFPTLCFVVTLATCEVAIERVLGSSGVPLLVALAAALLMDLRAGGLETASAGWVRVGRDIRAELVPLVAAELRAGGIDVRIAFVGQASLLRSFGAFVMAELRVREADRDASLELTRAFAGEAARRPSALPASELEFLHPQALRRCTELAALAFAGVMSAWLSL